MSNYVDMTFREFVYTKNVFNTAREHCALQEFITKDDETWIGMWLEGKNLPTVYQDSLSCILDRFNQEVYCAWIDKNVHCDIRLHPKLHFIDRWLKPRSKTVEYCMTHILYEIDNKLFDEIYVHLDSLEIGYDYKDGKLYIA